MTTKDLGSKAKDKLVVIVETIDGELRKYWEEELAKNCFGLVKRQKEMVKKIIEHLAEHNLRTGKRLRASLVWYGYKLAGGNEWQKIMKVCMAVELVHTALLIHDDFMDQDDLRRGKPTTQKFFGDDDEHFGEAMAVTVGDVALTLGYKLVVDSGFDGERIKEVMDCLLRGVVNTGYGQAWDLSLAKLADWTEEEVLALHKTKTAIYTFDNPLVMGAKLADADKKVEQTLSKYAMDLGVAFQLQDDVLGMFGDKGKTGKSDNSDLLQGKRTLLALKTIELAGKKRSDFLQVWGKREAKGEDIEKAKELVKSCGALAYNVALADKLAKQAIKRIEELRKEGLDDEAIDYLSGIAWYMVERNL